MPEAVPAVGVKVAVRVKPLPLIAPSVPPVVVMSLSVNPTGDSLKVKVMVAVSPTLTALTLLVMASVGAVVSTKYSALSEAAACEMVAALPAASLRVPPFKLRLFAPIETPFKSVCPARMVYVNTR